MNSKLLIAGTIAAMTISTSVAETCKAGADAGKTCTGVTILIDTAADVDCAGDTCVDDDYKDANAPCCTGAGTCSIDGKNAITKPCKLNYDSTTLCATGKFVYYDDSYEKTCNDEAEIEDCDTDVKRTIFFFIFFFIFFKLKNSYTPCTHNLIFL